MILNFSDTIKLLKKNKIDVGNVDVFLDEKEAQKFAERIKYPIALKVFGEDILHRTELNGISLNISDDLEFKKEFQRLKNISEQIIVQEMVIGYSVIVGIKRDDNFGPVIMFGLGGIFVEILKDVSFRICPIKKKDAVEMIKEIKAYKVLAGARGKKAINISKLADLLINVSKLAMENNIKEIDLNPVIVNDKQAIAIDFKFLL